MEVKKWEQSLNPKLIRYGVDLKWIPGLIDMSAFGDAGASYINAVKKHSLTNVFGSS